jgi:predicted Holliday junction resolvase-like endonuclease
MSPETQNLIILALAVLLVFLFVALITSPRRSAAKAQTLFQQWRAKELDLFQQWRAKDLETAKQELNRLLSAEYELKMLQWRGAHEANIRADAITRSAAVIRGKVSEHLAPFINFPYNPRDARFIGTPIDIIVFDGADEGNIREIVFLEVKSGLSPRLTPRERQVQQVILEKKVVWQELFIGVSELGKT